MTRNNIMREYVRRAKSKVVNIPILVGSLERARRFGMLRSPRASTVLPVVITIIFIVVVIVVVLLMIVFVVKVLLVVLVRVRVVVVAHQPIAGAERG